MPLRIALSLLMLSLLYSGSSSAHSWHAGDEPAHRTARQYRAVDTDGDGIPDTIDPQPSVAADPFCIEVNGDVTIASKTYTGTGSCTATGTIYTGNAVWVTETADVNYAAGDGVVLSPGFQVDPGGRFRARLTCTEYLNAIAPYSDLVSGYCDGTWFHLDAPTGLPDQAPADPDHRMMVDITGWILRVPIPYHFAWKIPLDPYWLTTYQEASPKGPIAVAANGVPIFHYEARPDVSTLPENYDPGSDTVLRGELDQCGGHAGQGDDYHYHYAPVCLLADHDLDTPIAWGLDGIPIYFGTGGTDYFGSGQYNDINNLPVGALDECNALARGDGTYVYYTTADPPYTIGCHRAYADPALRIEPRPLNGREQGTPNPYGGYFGEPMTTLVTDTYVDSNGWRHLEHDAFSGAGTSAVLYRKNAGAGADCWDFEYRGDKDTAETVYIHCR